MTTRRQFLASIGSLAASAATVRLAAQEKPDRPLERSPTAIPVSGTAEAPFQPLDRLMLEFLAEQNAVGGTLALARAGKILYARGFGYADRDAGQTMLPDTQLRIASVSKPVTGVATLMLAERGKLDLDAKACDLLALAKPHDPRFLKVTVRQLLHHTGGWDRDKSFDPMFRSVEIAKDQGVQPPAMPKDILHYMLRQPLDFDPGTRYAYSNFGYSILGLIIAHVTGQRYGQFVEQAILGPLKIHRTQLGKTLPDNRAEHEARYYDVPPRKAPAVMGPQLGQPVPLPYGAWCLEAMDAHGGWISTAPDLVRFASAFDDPERSPLLSAQSIATMFARPAGAPGEDAEKRPKDAWYGCGWSVRTAGRGLNTWHNGALSGTSTLLVRRHDGYNWAVLFNSRDGKEGALAGLIDGKVHRAVDQVKKNL